ncbi:alpha/beta fold hydrolase [Spirosoma arcticum]
MSQFQHHAVAIDYHVSGSIPVDPEAVTLLFVHGSYIDQTYWAEQVSYFSPSYQVVTLDLPGQGQSGRNRTDWSIEGYGDDVVALIKQLSLTRVLDGFATDIGLSFDWLIGKWNVVPTSFAPMLSAPAGYRLTTASAKWHGDRGGTTTLLPTRYTPQGFHMTVGIGGGAFHHR